MGRAAERIPNVLGFSGDPIINDLGHTWARGKIFCGWEISIAPAWELHFLGHAWGAQSKFLEGVCEGEKDFFGKKCPKKPNLIQWVDADGGIF